MYFSSPEVIEDSPELERPKIAQAEDQGVPAAPPASSSITLESRSSPEAEAGEKNTKKKKKGKKKRSGISHRSDRQSDAKRQKRIRMAQYPALTFAQQIFEMLKLVEQWTGLRNRISGIHEEIRDTMPREAEEEEDKN